MTELEQTLPYPVGRLHHHTRPRLVDDRHALGSATLDSGLAWARGHRARLMLTDIGIVTATVVAALATNVDRIAQYGNFAAHCIIAAVVLAVWATTLHIFRTRDNRVLCVGVTEYKRVVSASITTFGTLAIAFVIFQVDNARWYFILTFPIGVLGLVLSRWSWRKWLIRQGKLGHFISRAVVVGCRTDIEYVVRQITRKTSGAPYTIVGIIVDAEGTESSRGLSMNIPVSTDLDNVAVRAAALNADAVIIAGTPRDRTDFVRNLAWDLEGTATDLVIATNLANVAGPRIQLRPLEGLPLIHVEIPQFEGGKHALKRTFDVIVSSVMILTLLPLLAAIAIAVALDSQGPVLFFQERVGRDGKTFRMVKYRSMVTTATADLAGLLDRSEGAGVLFKLKNDPRVTRVGRVIRKYSLDELPQLWNILVGDMSLVGPRPPLPREVEQYQDHVHRRLYIRPGLTGMWQVNGRSNLDWEESVRLDLYYVENWSLVGDIMIMWRTLRQFSNPVGAY